MRAAFSAVFNAVEQLAMAVVSIARTLRKGAEAFEAEMDREYEAAKQLASK